MKYTTTSVYPNDIDPLIFFEDADINHAPLLHAYYQHLINNNFDAASSYLENTDLHMYGASLLNMIENRLRTTEENIDEVIGGKNIIVLHDQEEPVEKFSPECFNWIGGNKPIHIHRFSPWQTRGNGYPCIDTGQKFHTCMLCGFEENDGGYNSENNLLGHVYKPDYYYCESCGQQFLEAPLAEFEAHRDPVNNVTCDGKIKIHKSCIFGCGHYLNTDISNIDVRQDGGRGLSIWDSNPNIAVALNQYSMIEIDNGNSKRGYVIDNSSSLSDNPYYFSFSRNIEQRKNSVSLFQTITNNSVTDQQLTIRCGLHIDTSFYDSSFDQMPFILLGDRNGFRMTSKRDYTLHIGIDSSNGYLNMIGSYPFSSFSGTWPTEIWNGTKEFNVSDNNKGVFIDWGPVSMGYGQSITFAIKIEII